MHASANVMIRHKTMLFMYFLSHAKHTSEMQKVASMQSTTIESFVLVMF